MDILCAEDDPVARRLICYILARLGYRAITVSNGKAALEILTQEKAPTMAILDWMMPELSGIEVCQQLRALTRSEYCYIIMLTARSQREDMNECFAAGADDYLVKPATLLDIRSRVETGIRILRLKNELHNLRTLTVQQALNPNKIAQRLM